MKTLNKLPNYWYIKGCNSLGDFLRKLPSDVSQGWSGKAEGNGYYITPEGKWDVILVGTEGWTEISFDDFIRLSNVNRYDGLPEDWFIVGGTPEFQDFMKTQDTFWKGNGDVTGYYIRKESGNWTASKVEDLKQKGYKEISFSDFKKFTNNNQTTETMQNTESKTDRITAVITLDNKIHIEQNGKVIISKSIAKETITTRLVKLQSITYDRKDKAQENPIVTTVEREVSVSVIASKDGDLYTGYSIKNPTDKNVSPEIGKTIARNRAINPKTNLTPNDGITEGLISKHVLKGVAATIFEKMSKGSVKLKGVK